MDNGRISFRSFRAKIRPGEFKVVYSIVEHYNLQNFTTNMIQDRVDLGLLVYCRDLVIMVIPPSHFMC